jgi:ABC-2 type transport system permease protein
MKWWVFVVASEIRKILAFRFDFWVTFIGQSLIQIVISISLWKSIFHSHESQEMMGYSLQSIVLYYLIVPVGSKMLTGENIGFLSREIYDGSFNRYLLYPISFFQYKTLTYLTYSFFYGLQLVVIFLFYHILNTGLQAEQLLNLLAGFIFFLLASAAYSQLAMTIELISLWADNIWSLMVMTRFLCFFFGGAYIPVDFFPEFLKDVLVFTPFPYLINLPIKATMGSARIEDLLSGMIALLVWTLLFHLGARLLWKKGQYHYNGVGI